MLVGVALSDDTRWSRVNERIYFKHDDGELELRFTVGASRIPGADDGLFAARPYLTNDTLTYYAAAKKSDDLGRVGMPAADAKLERLEVPRVGPYKLFLQGTIYILFRIFPLDHLYSTAYSSTFWNIWTPIAPRGAGGAPKSRKI